MYAWCPQRPEEGVRSNGAGVTGGHELPRDCQKPNLEQVEEQLLTTETPLPPTFLLSSLLI